MITPGLLAKITEVLFLNPVLIERLLWHLTLPVKAGKRVGGNRRQNQETEVLQRPHMTPKESRLELTLKCRCAGHPFEAPLFVSLSHLLRWPLLICRCEAGRCADQGGPGSPHSFSPGKWSSRKRYAAQPTIMPIRHPRQVGNYKRWEKHVKGTDNSWTFVNCFISYQYFHYGALKSKYLKAP